MKIKTARLLFPAEHAPFLAFEIPNKCQHTLGIRSRGGFVLFFVFLIVEREV